MIKTSTVLVVGAGASAPYDFPTAAKVLQLVLGLPGFYEITQGRIPQDQEILGALYRVTGADHARVWPFAQRLLHSNIQSVDTLLEKHPADSWYQQIGKALIAWVLEPHLIKAESLQNPEHGDWLSFVWQRMCEGASSFEQFKQNRLRIVTFNFDTLIEHRLSRGISGLFNDGSYSAGRQYLDSIVTHVHGRLEARRDPNDMDGWLKEAIAAIDVVHQECDAELTLRISQLMREAEVICFLGFGYHEANVAKLKLPPGSNSDKGFFGTRLGIGEGRRPEIVKRLGNPAILHLGRQDEDCLNLLEANYILRS